MKKIARLMTLALVVFALASCEDVPSPFGTVTPPKGDSRGSDIPPTGTGTATDPFNVQKAIDFVKELGADVESETALYVKERFSPSLRFLHPMAMHPSFYLMIPKVPTNLQPTA